MNNEYFLPAFDVGLMDGGWNPPKLADGLAMRGGMPPRLADGT